VKQCAQGDAAPDKMDFMLQVRERYVAGAVFPVSLPDGLPVFDWPARLGQVGFV